MNVEEARVDIDTDKDIRSEASFITGSPIDESELAGGPFEDYLNETVSKEDLYAYIAILLILGINNVPNVQHCWNKKRCSHITLGFHPL